MSYYCSMPHMGAIEAHGRIGIQVHDDDEKSQGKPVEIFSCKKHETSIPHCDSITRKCTWPTYSAQSSKKIPADRILLRYLADEEEDHKQNLWASASLCWQADLFQPRSIIFDKRSSKHYLVLGTLAHSGLVVWEVESKKLGKSNHLVFLLGAGNIINKKPVVLTIIDTDSVQVVPSTPISPLNYHLALGKKDTHPMGVVILQYGKRVPVLLHAAERCFYTLSLPQLKVLASENDIVVETPTLPMTCTALIRHFWKKHMGQDISEQKLSEILALRCSDTGSAVAHVADEDMLLEVLDKEDLRAYQVPICLCVCTCKVK